MTLLLGNQNCLDCLRKDVTEVQGIIIDVFSRVGAVRYPSWKFPDKTACDLDLVTLLKRFDYVEDDPEYTQHSHIVLFELVIDRLVLLLQSFTHYVDFLTKEQSIPISKSVGPSMSVGLVVKKYWNSMLKLGTLHQQKKLMAADLSKLQSDLMNSKAEIKRLKNCSCVPCNSSSIPSSIKPTGMPRSQMSATPVHIGLDEACRNSPSIATDTRNIGSQTVESALVPCDACACTQATLKKVSNSIISICHNQNIPSALSRFQEVVKETLGNEMMTATDVAYWASEQSKDLTRINKHLTELMSSISPLKAELQATAEQQNQMKKKIDNFNKELEKEKEQQSLKIKEFDKQMEEINRKNSETVTKLEHDKERLRKGSATLEEKLSMLKDEVKGQHVLISELELSKQTLLEEMRTKMADKSVMLTLEEQVKLLTGQLTKTKQQLKMISSELDKEKVKINSMLRHEESLKAKIKTLLQRVDHLDEECEELNTKLAESEAGTNRLEEQLKTVNIEKSNVQEQLHKQLKLTGQLQQEKHGLEKSMAELKENLSQLESQVQEYKEQCRLLVAFPDLNMPSETQYESTGDIAQDMDKQLLANSLRINILEQENSRLRSTLTKLQETTQGALKIIPQTKLWSPSGLSEDGPIPDGNVGRNELNTAGMMKATRNLGVNTRPKSNQRPWSEPRVTTPSIERIKEPVTNVFNSPETSAIGVYARLKRAGALPGMKAISDSMRKNNRKLH
ncbi:coiled-coil domain-containing protein 157 isoform X1 [Scyliorhinus canicula]|uniref:coiled-coil domain-containing protein 157 isoform X1 n=2 Tax=Scyliorhinus canicula TaxID=7830 RepID=UPI0018F61C59|nr:coiled-coil domain-containing protein 157 isoform X1 [Scyliorhinus canicula]XP_038641487.1 coiled-coil domain-containing protein 157 isoform X1 [Scyliorhinus canicula]XP_038641570.1 coiled-coil domain-containing protein 157 isoform X1 [Scyliorhinus canicula]XP_038641656.1 coiled-coil domain-containing protein 157 isoform X1 [Scyliorhinus canicula]